MLSRMIKKGGITAEHVDDLLKRTMEITNGDIYTLGDVFCSWEEAGIASVKFLNVNLLTLLYANSI